MLWSSDNQWAQPRQISTTLILKQATAIANLSLLRAHTPSVSDVVGDECWAVELSVSEAFGSQNQ
ncbi:MAG: hypothetical protein NT013_20510, partial [Planctomycetia bacterium]|nr:hypothetical protein [Planctomycetia bacterium]